MSRICRHIEAMEAYIPGEQPADPNVVKLNTNENPYPPPAAVMDALRGLSDHDLRRYPDPECAEARSIIAARHGARAAQVICGNGSDELLALMTRAFVEADGSVGYFEPSYSLYPVLADIHRAEKRPVELGDDFTWNLPDDYRASLFFLTHPNAPTGTGYPRDTIETFCRSFSGVAVIDEAYAEFAEEQFADIARSAENVIVCRTLSKSCSLAGIRFGYAIGPEPLIRALYKVKDSYNVSAPTQRMACAALRATDEIADNIRRVKITRERTADALRGLDFTVLPSAANFIFTRPPDGRAEAWFRALRHRGILVRYFPGPRTGDFLRITIGTDSQMDRLLDVCAEVGPHPD